MISRLHLSTILVTAALIWGGLLVLSGVQVSPEWTRPLSTVTGVMVLLLAAFDLFLWKLSFLQGWFVKRPVLYGTWRTEIRSTWVDPSTGKQAGPIEAYMVVHQSFSALSLRLYTKESASELLGAEIVGGHDGVYRVAGVYRNEPMLSVRDRSQIHHGGLLLHVIGSPPTALKGHYWTDRKSAGEIELTERKTEEFHDFATAHAAFH